MVRNLVGSLVAVGQGKHPPEWIAELLAKGDRRLAAPTFAAAGLYLAGCQIPSAVGFAGCRRDFVSLPFAADSAGRPGWPMKPRIKICGLTRIEDLQQAVQAGADAIGLVFYPPSPRCVDLPTAARLARAVPPFVSIVGLFVNADPATVRATLAAVPIHLLQLHGDEDEAYCRQFDRPYIKAARVRPGMDLVQYAAAFPSAQAILLDAFVDGYGGGGRMFDWSLVPPSLGKP
jgi:phosphoribosylanthranilate isomerase